ncbi:MAG: GTP-binding protein, partial [Pseudomonadota bacterium]
MHIKKIPTNVITGFLGAGKTTAILGLLASRPQAERWAVLVNEFGEIGIDGSLLRGASSSGEVFIREVPGGCMCCTAGLPMQVALNQLLRRSQPHRLLIEPTGLGHPQEVIDTLSSGFNGDALALKRTLTLVDARKLASERYTSHPTFLQQIALADVIVANKADLYAPGDLTRFEQFVQRHGKPGVDTLVTEQARIPIDLLGGDAKTTTTATIGTDHADDVAPAGEPSLPPSGILCARNEGDGYESLGWRFRRDHVFDKRQLYAFLTGLDVERMKAVFITDEGVFGYNFSQDAL